MRAWISSLPSTLIAALLLAGVLGVCVPGAGAQVVRQGGMPGLGHLPRDVRLGPGGAHALGLVTEIETNYGVTVRPRGTRYLVEQRPHFDLIYDAAAAETARQMGDVLEATLDATDALVRGHDAPRLHMPVVVNGYNDRSNGFVQPVPFRQEIEAPSIVADDMVTFYASWPAQVMPHELVHALHAETHGGVGVGALVRLFAPDVARAINLGVPLGASEGIAVYRESRVQPGAGRLNNPLATMPQMAARADEGTNWTLAQAFHPPVFHRPFDRHYLGGGQAMAFLAARDTARGEDPARSFRRAQRFYDRAPFLGYGVALRVGAGAWPRSLTDAMQRDAEAAARRRRARLDSLRDASSGTFPEPRVLASADGLVHRRPHWTDDATLVAYVRGYDVTPGVHRIDARTGRRTSVATHAVAEPRFALSRDTTALLLSRYVPDPVVPSQFLAEAERLDLATGRVTRLTDGGRVLAPVERPDGGGLWAIQTDGAQMQWAVVQEDGTATPLTDLPNARFQQIAPSPDGRTVAVLLNIEGRQQLYRATFDSTEDGDAPTLTPWIGFETGAIYDVTWSADGRYVLFAADPPLGGTSLRVANAYAYDTATRRLLRLTHARYGALEPTLSPDGQTLAYVRYRFQRYDLVRQPFRPGDAEVVATGVQLASADAASVAPTPPPVAPEQLPSAAAASAEASPEASTEPSDAEPYRAREHLAPRMVYPTIRYDTDEVEDAFATELGLGLGLAVEGADPLERYAYRAEAFGQDGRMWGQAFVQTGRHGLRPSAEAYARPFTANMRVTNADGARVDRRVGVEERGAGLGTETQITLENNVRQSVLFLWTQADWRQTRRFGEGLRTTPFRDRVTLRPTAFLAWRVQQNARDLVPNQGLTLLADADLDAWAEGAASPSRAFTTETSLYLPWLRATNTGLRLRLGTLTQSRGALVNLDTFVPRGHEDAALGPGTFVRAGAEVVQPLAYPDTGSLLLPVYFDALYAYGFAQSLHDTADVRADPLASVGAGLGLRLRLFVHLPLDLRLGLSVRPGEGDAVLVGR